VASRTSDGLIGDDTSPHLNKTLVWTYRVLSGK